MATNPQISNRWLTVLIIAFPFAEIGVTVLLTRWLGAGVAFSLYAIPAILGLLIQWRRAKTIRSIWGKVSQRDREAPNGPPWADPALKEEWDELICYYITFVFLLIPGLISHILAFLLIITPTRKRIISYAGSYLLPPVSQKMAPNPPETEEEIEDEEIYITTVVKIIYPRDNPNASQ
ncbi:MAG TPA: FxsA family protein [Chthonomonadaceae bacterium]|nr:FxsA family protein [Chthonomonadaceae bacterium]